ncbi:MAG: glycoside hydrolase family 97 protein, partial [Bacteroidetes bacterium]|nr:glycoside hydrolase family 97 protein [Bacteroidota bacterium]
MKRYFYLFFLPLLLNSLQDTFSQKANSIQSPNGNFSITIQPAKDGSLTYSLVAWKQTVIANSPMGFAAGKEVVVPSLGWTIENSEQHTENSVWKPVWGKRSAVPDEYNQLTLNLSCSESSIISHLRLEVRLYNDGAAFRYCIPAEEKNNLTATSELTEFRFAGDYTAWFYNGENANIGPEKISESEGKRFPVMTVKAANDLYLAIHEADLETGDPLVLQSQKGNTAFSVVSNPGKLEAGYHSAWRV